MRRLLSMMKALLTSLLRHPRLLVEIGFVFLGILVWFAGPFFGLVTVEARVKVIIGLSVLRLIVFLLDYYLAQKNARQLEASLQVQAQQQAASARPDRQEEIGALRLQFEKAVSALKQSSLGRGRKGKAALYALPWYMFIGPPASGKSTALRHSGLQFPYMGGSGQGLQGVGGTRNCDWWFTNEAVLLDTAGRYVTHDEDQEEWFGFLDLLKKYRKGKPINGVLAAISIADLIRASDGELEAHAKKMRSRIDELIKRLGIVFPVYLIFTKCDLVQGFVEFFEDLNRSERQRIWGCTFAKTENAADPAQVRFKSEFDVLLEALRARRLTRLASARGPHKISIYGFSLQLASAREKLTRFVEILFERNPYQENPPFRGFYLTSGTQEGTPIDRILGAVSRASGLPEVAAASLVPTEPKSYFLNDLFTEIIFPDQILAGPSSALHRQRGYFRVGVFAAAVLILAVSVTGLAISYVGNRQLISGSFSASLNVPQVGLVDEAHVEKNVEFLERLRSRVHQLRGYEQEGVPGRLWLLYRGDRVYRPVRDLYVKHFNRLFLVPTKHYVERNLQQFARKSVETPKDGGSDDFYYFQLKAYIMMSGPTWLNSSFLERWLSDHWNERLRFTYGNRTVPEWVKEDVTGQMAFYSRYLAAAEAENFLVNRRLVYETQRALRRVPMIQRVYARTRREARESHKPYTLQVAVKGIHQGSLVSEYSIPGIFTYEGWGSFQSVLARVLAELGQEEWVIGVPKSDPAELERGVKKLYLDEYVRHWGEFLRSVRIRPVVTPANTEEMLGVLSRVDSPLLQLLEGIDRNTVPDPGGVAKLGEAASGLFQKVKKGLGLGSSEEVALPPLAQAMTSTEFSRGVSVRFQSLHQLVVAPDKEGAESPLALYLGELRNVHRALRKILRSDEPNPDTMAIARSIVLAEPSDLLQAFNTTDTILLGLDLDSREAMLPLLYEPLVMSMRGVFDRAKSVLSRRWESQVYQACRRNIEGRYPFRPVGGDAALTDVVDFFHPENGLLWKFYRKELKPFVKEGLDKWEPKTWSGIGMPLSTESLEGLRYARFLSESLFTTGSSALGSTFELYPYPPKGAVSRRVSEIRLEVGGQAHRYRMEPQEWHEMKWPGEKAAAGAVLQVQVGTSWATREFKDWWGLFRLLETGRITPLTETKFRVQWDLETPDAQTVEVQYVLKSRSSKNPFRPGLFEQFRCVYQL